MHREAVLLKETLQIRFKGVLRILQYHYNILIDKTSLRKKLSYYHAVQNPKDLDCIRLVKIFLEYRKKITVIKVLFKQTMEDVFNKFRGRSRSGLTAISLRE